MRVGIKSVRLLVEALEREGLSPTSVLDAIGLTRAELHDDRRFVSWTSLTDACVASSRLVDDDPIRLRALGRAMLTVASYARLRRLARIAVSSKRLYELAARWLAPADFPHLSLQLSFHASGLLVVDGIIPASYTPCEPFLHISTGALTNLPTLLGLPPSELLIARVGVRTLRLELRLPPRTSTWRSLVRPLRAAMRLQERAEVLEHQRLELADALDSSAQARDELRAVLERLPDMVLIHVEGRIVFVNRALVRTLGHASQEELIGQALEDLLDPRSLATYASRVAMPSDSLDLPELTEVWVRTQSAVPLLVEVTPPQSVMWEGEVGRLVVGRDIAERVRLQQKLATADRLASLGLLAAGVAHEVNNPLSYLLNNIEIARKQLASLGPEADVARDALHIALEGVDRIRFIVRELLFLARAEPGPVATTDLGSAVESTLSLARTEIERTAKLCVELAVVPPVRASVPRLAQIVLNLVLNALEAMRTRPVSRNVLSVRVRREAGRSSGGGSGEAGAVGAERVVLEVADNGVGIAPESMSRLFDPFYSTKPDGQGTGLGLAITQRLVGELGAHLSFTSEVGVGTVFRVAFAVDEDERALPARSLVRDIEHAP